MIRWEQFDSKIHHFGIPVVALAVTIIIGIVIDRWVISRVRRYAKQTGWTAGEAVVKALSGSVALLAILIGVRNAVAVSPIPSDRIELVNTGLSTASIAFVTWVIERGVSGAMKAYENREGAVIPNATIFNNMTKIVIYLLGTLVVLHTLGISVTPMITALGIGGLAVALALKDTLSNLFSGIQVILSKQLSIGDYVQVGPGQEGYVVDITLRSTTIRSLANNLILVPNATVAAASIVNFGPANKALSFSVPMNVAYGSDLDAVEQMIREVIHQLQADFVEKMPIESPNIRFIGFGDASIQVNVALRVSQFEFKVEIRHEFIKRMHKVFATKGIFLPLPLRDTPPVAKSAESVE